MSELAGVLFPQSSDHQKCLMASGNRSDGRDASSGYTARCNPLRRDARAASTYFTFQPSHRSRREQPRLTHGSGSCWWSRNRVLTQRKLSPRRYHLSPVNASLCRQSRLVPSYVLVNHSRSSKPSIHDGLRHVCTPYCTDTSPPRLYSFQLYDLISS
nr:hypothetical protein CFP56_20582 [Quercus suber]